MEWFYYTLLACPAFALRDILYKYFNTDKINLNIFDALMLIISGIISFIYLIYKDYNNNVIKNISKKTLLNATCIAILNVIGILTYFRAIQASSNPELVRGIFAGLIIIIVLSFSVYKKNYLSFHQYIGIIFIIIGIFLAYNKNLKLY